MSEAIKEVLQIGGMGTETSAYRACYFMGKGYPVLFPRGVIDPSDIEVVVFESDVTDKDIMFEALVDDGFLDSSEIDTMIEWLANATKNADEFLEYFAGINKEGEPLENED